MTSMFQSFVNKVIELNSFTLGFLDLKCHSSVLHSEMINICLEYSIYSFYPEVIMSFTKSRLVTLIIFTIQAKFQYWIVTGDQLKNL